MVRPLRIERPGRGQSSRAVQRRETGRLSEPLRGLGKRFGLVFGAQTLPTEAGQTGSVGRGNGLCERSGSREALRYVTEPRQSIGERRVKLQAALMEAYE